MTNGADQTAGQPDADAHRGPWTQGFDHRARIRDRAGRFDAALGVLGDVMFIEGLAYLATLFVKMPPGLSAGLNWLEGVLLWVAGIIALAAIVLAARLQEAIVDHAQDIARGKKDPADV